MAMRHFIWAASALVALSLAGFGAWMLSLPAGATAMAAPPVPRAEADAMLATLKPPKRERPLVAIIGINDATETTDYVIPTGILRRADVADVVMLATHPGPVQLYPALKVEPDATVAQFDAAHPEGADYVLVPAMSRDDDPVVLDWIRSQAGKGATVIGICVGVKVVAAAGVLDGTRATTHWYVLDDMLDRHPTIRYVPNRRMVADEGVVTTTGITASMPMMLTLIEAIAGRAKALSVARDLGVEQWSARHASDAFKFTRPFAMTVLGNRLAVWNREEFGIRLRPGMDEVSLALVADAWSRTYRSRVATVGESPGTVETANGIRIIPDRATPGWTDTRRVPGFAEQKPAHALDQALQAIAARYGDRTAYVVAMQLEYPRAPAGHVH
jgi:transcriptional regulator GlxA family with amidase domain